jgi:hypothetical protein
LRQMQTTVATGMKHFGGAIFAAWLAVGYADATSAKNVAVSFSVRNSLGATISLQVASCSPRASIEPPLMIANNATRTFSASAAGGTLLCTVRYQRGAGGCQFQVQVNAVGRITTGFATANAYKVTGGRPSCGGNGLTATSQEAGTFTMQ